MLSCPFTAETVWPRVTSLGARTWIPACWAKRTRPVAAAWRGTLKLRTVDWAATAGDAMTAAIATIDTLRIWLLRKAPLP